MHKRDYLVKQFEEFSKVIAILLGLKRDGKFSELSELIHDSLKKYTALEVDYVESIPDETLISTLTDEKKLSDDQIKMLADLIYEKAECYEITGKETSAKNSYKKANIIYLFLKEHATLSFSLDMHYKIELLKKMKL